MIYLDLDGPMVDWDGGVFELYGKPRLYPTKYNERVADLLGVSKSEIWEKIRKAGEKWWVNLKPQPWAQSFYDELNSIDEVRILSSPSHIAEGSSGKVKWMQNFFGGNFRSYILTSLKDSAAKPGAVLIDDMDENIDIFNQAGGIGIIFPRMWNRAWKDTDNAISVVLENLSKIYPHYKPPRLRVEEDEEYEFLGVD